MILKDAKVFITGGAGFIGSHLVDKIIAAGNDVVVFDDFSTGLQANLEAARESGRLKVVRASVTNFTSLCESMNGCDYVFHLATQNVRLSLRQPTTVHDVNTTGSFNVLKAAHATGIKRLLYCSSSEVNGTANKVPMAEEYDFKPETIYGASKLAGEYYALAFHRSGWLPVVVARPHNSYGPREHAGGSSGEVIPRFILQAKAGQPLTVYGDGNQTRDFTYVEETSQFLLDLLESDAALGKVVNVCKGHEVSIGDLAKKIINLTNSSSEIHYTPARPSDVLRLYGDNRRLFEILGRVPSVSLDDGLMKTIEWFSGYPNHNNLSDLSWLEVNSEEWLQ